MVRGRSFLEMVQMHIPGHSFPIAAPQTLKSLFSFSSEKYYAQGNLAQAHTWGVAAGQSAFRPLVLPQSCLHGSHLSGPQVATTKLYISSPELLIFSGTHISQHLSEASLTSWNCCQRGDQICILSPFSAWILKGHIIFFNSISIRITWHCANSCWYKIVHFSLKCPWFQTKYSILLPYYSL